jgi:hypothetical protein
MDWVVFLRRLTDAVGLRQPLEFGGDLEDAMARDASAATLGKATKSLSFHACD